MMKMRLKRGILIVLLTWDGQPMDENALVSGVQLNVRPFEPTVEDVLEALRDVEAGGFVVGATDDFTRERTWSLTVSGIHQARKMR